MRHVDIYGTIGPMCSDVETLAAMFDAGMTGIRLNLSHVTLKESENLIANLHKAAEMSGVKAQLLIDLQGPELRIGRMNAPLDLREGDVLDFMEQGDPDARKRLNHPLFHQRRTALLLQPYIQAPLSDLTQHRISDQSLPHV